MLKLTIDVTKFLSLPLNDGRTYVDLDGVCGCIKGNFARATKELEQYGRSWDVANYYLGHALRNKHVGYRPRIPIHYSITEDKQHLVHFDPILSEILDRAEHILINKQRPQFAKLFLVKALRKYGYVEKAITQTPVLSHA